MAHRVPLIGGQVFPRRGNGVSRSRQIVATVLLIATLCGCLSSAQDTTQQSEAKARFLAIVPGFVQWPQPAFAVSERRITDLCAWRFWVWNELGCRGAKFKRRRTSISHQVGPQRSGFSRMSGDLREPISSQALRQSARVRQGPEYPDHRRR
jgi:hypothetical protein